jgi:hypothetical protein
MAFDQCIPKISVIIDFILGKSLFWECHTPWALPHTKKAASLEKRWRDNCKVLVHHLPHFRNVAWFRNDMYLKTDLKIGKKLDKLQQWLSNSMNSLKNFWAWKNAHNFESWEKLKRACMTHKKKIMTHG